jgi:hypothetical protein
MAEERARRRALGLGAAAVALALPSIARAEPPKESAKEPSEVNMARVDVAGAYTRGLALVGHGSRGGYQDGTGEIRLGLVRFPWDRVGFDLDLRLGISVATGEDKRYEAGFDAAIDVAPLRWKGPWAGSLVLGAGAGIEASRPFWLEQRVQGYPLILARLRLLPAPAVPLLASWRFVPITTSAPWVRAHEIEVGAGYRWVQAGLRVRVSEVTGGDPQRTFRAIGFGPYFGAAFY